MSTATAERTSTAHEVGPAAVGRDVAGRDGVDRDGLDVYCPESQSWARTRDLFCENCGDPGHDLR